MKNSTIQIVNYCGDKLLLSLSAITYLNTTKYLVYLDGQKMPIKCQSGTEWDTLIRLYIRHYDYEG